MTQAFDDRLVTLSITLDGETITYDQSYTIEAFGTKFANAVLSQCQMRIYNISKTVRDRLITKTSPFILQRDQIIASLDVGRKSYGTFRLFQGNIIASSPSQPPDIGVTFTSQTLSFMLGNPISVMMPENATLKSIAQQVAKNLGVALDFKATDKNVNNYSFMGAAIKQVQCLAEAGNVNAFIDNNTLHVRDVYKPSDSPIEINKHTGMVGVPEITETGIRVKCLILNEIKTTDTIRITSDVNPAANGDFVIFKLNFELATRETPFYWIIEATKYRLGISQ